VKRSSAEELLAARIAGRTCKRLLRVTGDGIADSK